MRRVLLAIVLVSCGASSSEPPPVPSGSLGTMDLPPAKPAPSATAPKRPPPPTSDLDTPTLSVPGPLALPCTDDTQCGIHRCNKQYGKCTYPCQAAADCLSGAECLSGLCIPRAPRP